MDDGFTPPRSPGSRADPDAAAWDEDFLYHLSRGSDFLVENRVVEAKEELERALRYRPQDSKSQDLLAGVYFRLGFYPRAIEIWERLTRAHPDDVTLRVNLGLALFKTGQPEDALAHLDRALALEPEHARAWGYVGLVQWRMGKLDAARDAFARGGQASMARRMEELVASTAGELLAPEPEPEVRDRDVAELRTTAGEALDRLDDAAPLTLEPTRAQGRERRPSGSWRVVEAGADAMPRTSHALRPTSIDAPMSLGALLDWWAPSIGPEQSLVVTPAGTLVLATRDAVHGRASTIRALRGTATASAMTRRFRRGTDEILGDDEPIFRWEGELLAVVAQRPGERFQALRIEDDVLYVVERFVQAFDDRVSFESGRLPAHAGAGRLVQFRGTGTIVLRLPRPPSAFPVKGDEVASIAPESLLGWTGRLFPLEEPSSAAEGATLALRGDGTVLLV